MGKIWVKIGEKRMKKSQFSDKSHFLQKNLKCVCVGRVLKTPFRRKNGFSSELLKKEEEKKFWIFLFFFNNF
jgi:hypothetical protein